MKYLFLIYTVFLSILVNAQSNLKVWVDTVNSKHTYHTFETLAIRIKVQNLSKHKICFVLKTELVTSDNKIAEIHSGIFSLQYSHGGPDPNDYVWKDGEFKDKRVKCPGDDFNRYVKPNHTYVQLETLQENILATSTMGRYRFNLPIGMYHFKLELKSSTGEYISLDYPIQIIDAPISVKKGLISVYQTCNYFPYGSTEELVANSLNIYKFLDTCSSPFYRDKAFILMAPSAPPVKTQQDVDRLISYFPKIDNNDVVVNMACKLTERFTVCRYEKLENVDKFSTYKNIIQYFLKREQSMANAFFTEIYMSEKSNQHTIYVNKSCLSAQSSLLTEQQLLELENLLNF